MRTILRRLPSLHAIFGLMGLSLSLVALLTACVPSINAGGTTALSLQTTPISSAPKTQTTTVQLLHAPVGSVDVDWSQKKRQLTLAIQVSGLAPGSAHPEHIHMGTCQGHSGAILMDLPTLRADANGQAHVQTTFPLAQSPRVPWVLTIHNGPTLKTPDELLSIACAQISIRASHRDPFQTHVALSGTNSPNQAVFGTARLSLHHGDLTVVLSVHGLIPGSRHAAHIHQGSCERQGKVIFPFNPLVANNKGDATETITFHHVTAIPRSGWYINIHLGILVATPTFFDPIACRNVVGS